METQALVKVLTLVCLLLSLATPAQTGRTIIWDRQSLMQIERGASYGRMERLDSGDILCCFEKDRGIWVTPSRDNGRTWAQAIFIANAPSGYAANPEVLQLQDGNILLFHNERPDDGVHRFAIVCSISADGGRTWQPHSRVYEADTEWNNGCWEPAAIQLPSGEVQVFFANENPYRHSDEQEITLMRSHDNGRTWGPPRAISFRANHRDGMPVPLILHQGKGIVVAIEDNGYSRMFHPAFIYTSVHDNWNLPAATGASPRRWLALDEPFSQEWGGAPYLCQMPGGEIILSFQSSVGRDYPQMVVYVGDETCHNFEGRSVPFEVPTDEGGWWNSLFVKDASTVTAISGCNGGLWAIDGQIVTTPDRS